MSAASVLAELRQAGLIRHVGLSNVTLQQLRTAQSIVPVAAVTALYNVTLRAGADLLAAAEEDQIVFSPWHPVTTTDGPLASRAVEVLPPIAVAHGASVQQVALAWQFQGSPQAREPGGAVDQAQPGGDAGHRRHHRPCRRRGSCGLMMPIAGTFPLEEWRAAMEISLSGRARGKLLLL
jgi:hypothetical protein